ncbi:MAG: glycosyltransferase, partial [Burkholderiales bacterium]
YALRAAIRKPGAFVFLHDRPLLEYRMHGANTILSGALRNHVEAAHVLRRAIAARHGAGLRRPLARVRLLDRFVRKRMVWEREQARNELAVAAERERAVHGVERDRLQAEVGALRAIETALREQEAALRAQAVELRAQEQALRTHRDALQAELERTHARLRTALEAEVELARVYASVSWEVTAPLRWAARKLGQMPLTARLLRGARRRAARIVRRYRPAQLPPGLRAEAGGAGTGDPGGQGTGGPGAAGARGRGSGAGARLSRHCTPEYAMWLAAEEAALAGLIARAPQLVEAVAAPPKLSVLLPVHDTDPAMLEAAIDSVFAQAWPHWELCIVDDASTRAETVAVLARAAERSPQVRLATRTENGHIAVASNDALGLAGGEFVLLLDHDDLLAPHALLRMAQAIAAQPDADLLYSDEDKLDEHGLRCLPFFKPDWSPALALVQSYVGHLLCARRSLVEAVGGFRAGFEGSQDFDLVLRLSERARRIVHLPEVLYHWRMHAASTAAGTGAKPYAHEAGRRAVAEHLARRYPEPFDRVDDADHTFVYVPRFKLPADTLVSIVIPTRDRLELLAPCVDSILARSSWQRLEILILDNGSREPATLDWLRSGPARDARIRVVAADMPFNWSRLNNLGAREARGQVLVFLNNDTEVVTPDWIERLAGWALLPDVGTVGARLHYPDGTIQHAGVVVGIGGWADHVFKGQRPEHWPSPYVSSLIDRNVTAVTGACMAVARAHFEALDGFDEAFEICGSDVDIGLRAHRQGLQNVYVAEAVLLHHESKTRGARVPENDFRQSELKYAPYRTEGDPFFNRNLSYQTPRPEPRYPRDRP